MTDALPGRPIELQIVTADVVNVNAMPLITSLAYGEKHSSKMVNMATAGVLSPGFYSGYKPLENGTMGLVVKLGDEGLHSVATVNIGLQQIRVFQQKDIVVELVNGVINTVVLEGFYEDGVLTTQVAADSTIEPALVKVITPEEVLPEHLIICDVDLRLSPPLVLQWMIDETRRTNANIDVVAHEKKANPHPQYNPIQVVHIVDNNDVVLSTTNVNLIVGDYERQLRPYVDGTVIEIYVASSVVFDDVSIILTPPDDEEFTHKGNS